MSVKGIGLNKLDFNNTFHIVLPITYNVYIYYWIDTFISLYLTYVSLLVYQNYFAAI